MNYNEKVTLRKRKIAHPWVLRGAASAPFVPAQGLRAQGNSLSPQPRPLKTVILVMMVMLWNLQRISLRGQNRGVAEGSPVRGVERFERGAGYGAIFGMGGG